MKTRNLTSVILAWVLLLHTHAFGQIGPVDDEPSLFESRFIIESGDYASERSVLTGDVHGTGYASSAKGYTKPRMGGCSKRQVSYADHLRDGCCPPNYMRPCFSECSPIKKIHGHFWSTWKSALSGARRVVASAHCGCFESRHGHHGVGPCHYGSRHLHYSGSYRHLGGGPDCHGGCEPEASACFRLPSPCEVLGHLESAIQTPLALLKCWPDCGVCPRSGDVYYEDPGGVEVMDGTPSPPDDPAPELIPMEEKSAGRWLFPSR